jgi:hypothetical protein
MSSNHDDDDDDAIATAAAATALQHRQCEDDGKDPKSVVQRRRRTGLLISAVLYTVLYVGAFFGWGPMQLLFEDHGFFSWKCPDDFVPTTTNNDDNDASADVCPEQTAALLNVNMVGQLTQITAPLLGYIADHYGAHILVYMMAVSCITGLLLIIVAAETATDGVDLLLYPAFGLLGLTTWMGGLLTVQTGLYFASDQQTQSRVIFVLNALFDAGSVTYLGLWALQEWFGASLTIIIAGYTVSAVLVYGSAVYFWSVAVPDTHTSCSDSDPEEEKEKTCCASDPEEKEKTCCDSDPEEEKEKEEHIPVAVVGKNDENATIDSSVAVPTTLSHDDDGHGSGNLNNEQPDSNVVGSEPNLNEDDIQADTEMKKEATVSDDSASGGKEYIIVADRRSRQQLTSGPYLLLVVFFAFHLTGNQWNLTTQRDFLAYLGDDEQDNKYLTIFTLLMPASIVGLPFVDAAITHYGFIGGLQGINLLALAYNLIKVRTQLTNDR